MPTFSLSRMTTMPVRWTRMLGAPWVAAPGSWDGEAHPGSGPLARGCLCRVSTLAADSREKCHGGHRSAANVRCLPTMRTADGLSAGVGHRRSRGDGRSVAARRRWSRPPCRTRNVPGAQRRRRDDGRWSLVRRAAGGTCGAGSDRAVNATTYGCIVAGLAIGVSSGSWFMVCPVRCGTGSLRPPRVR